MAVLFLPPKLPFAVIPKYRSKFALPCAKLLYRWASVKKGFIHPIWMHDVTIIFHLSVCLPVCDSVCHVQDASVEVLHGFVEHLEWEDTETQGR